ncbi:MAG TPA: NPCBM/NEW2 domain-containing protein [Opitutaceae bacterium]|nr:NPCBM/NEW2 domain-containing protein [Opitutaceae bacterium]
MPTSALTRLFVVLTALGTGLLRAAEPLPFYTWAEKPPMGWNSWDCFATTVTEAQTKAHADIMAEKLARFGYNIVTVDIQWYEPDATGFDYRQGAKLEMDEFGRLIPAANKFPSAAGGKGFKPLADYIHAKGLKFGIHFMRGIPRQAVAARTPVKGTNVTAADIADVKSVCLWNTDMYGVDLAKPGAQEYYNSLFEQFAAWGIDFIKVDDLSAPLYHRSEIEAIRKAIDRSGRPIVLSTSPGATPVADGAHVSTHANMWRVSDDFWDNWTALVEQFARLRDWTPYRGPGHFPDADMLPLGTISMGQRQTNFTPGEQVTLLSLWSIARSPLILGADLTKLDAATLALITNEEVIAVDQGSANNRELFQRDGFYGWVADIPGTEDRYLALFNTRPKAGDIDPARAAFTSPLISRDTPGHGVRIDLDVTGATKLFLVADDGRDGDAREDVVWAEPTLVTTAGTRKLTELKWVGATSRHGTQVSIERSASGKAMNVAGRPVPFGVAVRPKSVIEYDLPAGCTRFQVFAGRDDSGAAPPAGSWAGPPVRFMVFTQSPYATAVAAAVPVKLSELGFTGACRIRDLWQKKDLDPVIGEFAPVLNGHGAGLYRVSAVRPRPLAGFTGSALILVSAAVLVAGFLLFPILRRMAMKKT